MIYETIIRVIFLVFRLFGDWLLDLHRVVAKSTLNLLLMLIDEVIRTTIYDVIIIAIKSA